MYPLQLSVENKHEYQKCGDQKYHANANSQQGVLRIDGLPSRRVRCGLLRGCRGATLGRRCEACGLQST